MAVYQTKSASETEALGERLAAVLQPGAVVAFTGGLGSGKTAFVRGLARGLACRDAVSSPTFAIANYYNGPRPLAHFDAYRISGMEDLEVSGFYDYLDAGAILAVEWSENIEEYLPTPYIQVDFTYISPEERSISIEGARDF